jgi:hypothetical protein
MIMPTNSASVKSHPQNRIPFLLIYDRSFLAFFQFTTKPKKCLSSKFPKKMPGIWQKFITPHGQSIQKSEKYRRFRIGENGGILGRKRIRTR